MCLCLLQWRLRFGRVLFQYEDQLACYLKKIRKNEEDNKKKIDDISQPNSLRNSLRKFYNIDINSLPLIDENTSIKLSEEQIRCIDSIIKSPISLITGQAGCGKTTIIKFIIKMYSQHETDKINPTLTSFTGKAVNRIKSVCEVDAATIHSILKGGNIDPKVIIIDEISMVSTKLLCLFLAKYCDDILKIIFIGDHRQLEPIEWKSVIYSFIDSSARTTSDSSARTISDSSARTTSDSSARTISDSSAKINKNSDINFVPIINYFNLETVHRGSSSGIPIFANHIYTELNYPETMPKSVMKLGENYNDLIKKLTLFSNMLNTNTKIICQYRKDCNMINKFVQNLLFSNSKRFFKYYSTVYYVGDSVMLLRNFNSLSISNGEEGKVAEIDTTRNVITVEFQESPNSSVKRITFGIVQGKYSGSLSKPNTMIISAKYLTLSYAVTVHKSQGSEWENVIFYLPPRKHTNFINKSLIYTAVTRAKQKLFIFSSDTDFNDGLSVKIPKTINVLSLLLNDKLK